MNLAQTANRLTKTAIADQMSNIENAPEYDAFYRINNALSFIAIASSKGAYQTTINRPFAEKTDEVVRGSLEAAGFKLDIDSRPGNIIINWE